jgi:hypothetical protein
LSPGGQDPSMILFEDKPEILFISKF